MNERITPRAEEARELTESFEYNDRDGDGQIQFDEFLAMLEDLEAGVSEEEARLGFAEIDTSGNGSIGLDEFIDWWRER